MQEPPGGCLRGFLTIRAPGHVTWEMQEGPIFLLEIARLVQKGHTTHLKKHAGLLLRSTVLPGKICFTCCRHLHGYFILEAEKVVSSRVHTRARQQKHLQCSAREGYCDKP